MRMKSFANIVCVLGLSACGSTDDRTDSSDHNQPQSSPVCSSNSDCPQGYVCLLVGESRGCAAVCTGDVSACGSNASCGGVGVLEVDVCQEAEDPTGNDTPPDPEEQPRIPCKSDAECSALQTGAICAQFQGARDCTLPCTLEPQCDMPSMGGITIDFMACITDEGHATRKACLPDTQCFLNPLACVTFDEGGGGEEEGSCEPIGEMCFGPSECCSNACAGGACCSAQDSVCTTDYDCCDTGCYEGQCCAGPAETASGAAECCAGLSYASATGTCCVATGDSGCSSDGDCCDWFGWCVDGVCQ